LGDNVFARTLARALELEGSAQSLASLLRVPEGTLLRWCDGRADMPVRAFTTLVGYVSAKEARDPAGDSQSEGPAPTASHEALEFNIGSLVARCDHCGHTQFRRSRADLPLKMTSRLLCRACGTAVVHGDLLVALGHQLIAKKRVEALERNRRQAAMRAARRVKRRDEVT